MSTTSEYMGTIWQPGCTDSTGKATECPQVCPGMNNDFDGLNPVSGWNIQTCDFGTYCCRAINDNRSCCNNSTAPSFTSSTLGGYDFKAAAVDSSSPTVVTTTAIASSPSATGSPPNAGAKLIPNADVCESEKHKTLVVGGTIGGVLGAAVVGLLGLVFWMAKREQRQRKLKEHYEEQFAQTWAYRKHMAASTTSVKTESHEMKTPDHHEEFMNKASGS
ncbi:hypothetical protein E8E13_001742 [Curvularia kusanoi]|uniref:Uncharacterized protein n=1 Tax=Curvularia kusanoi TaxID=90978 RepID=A0A9P4W6M3_CURKU|nr:hypothetical protein E8E13_001742 [Curvularia kusanoi]